MEPDTVKVGDGIVVVDADGEVTITLPEVSDVNGYGVNEGRLNLNGKDFNYSDATGDSSQGWTNPQLAYVPVLVDISQFGEYTNVTDVFYNGESGTVIEIAGTLYLNIPVAENNADPASGANVSNWSLLDPAETTVVVIAEDLEGRPGQFTFTATTAAE